MKLAYEIEIEPEEIETLYKIVKNIVKEFLNEIKQEDKSTLDTFRCTHNL